jgi:hypothetical protein
MHLSNFDAAFLIRSCHLHNWLRKTIWDLHLLEALSGSRDFEHCKSYVGKFGGIPKWLLKSPFLEALAATTCVELFPAPRRFCSLTNVNKASACTPAWVFEYQLSQPCQTNLWSTPLQLHWWFPVFHFKIRPKLNLSRSNSIRAEEHHLHHFGIETAERSLSTKIQVTLTWSTETRSLGL